ncbi:MAG TPA: SDR family oxidoreductase [Candidatus Baltobacteraceae bacterium]|nr:SDR family oxidoreductase [Candidatus Baltobacteraceae bacterium]
MDLGIAGRGALVTGGSDGIGLAISQALAAEGARVAIAARTQSHVEAAVATLGGHGAGRSLDSARDDREHCGYTVDLTAEDGPRRLLAACAEFGAIDILIHNLGGTLGVNDPLAPVARWRDVFRLNLEVAIELNDALVPAMTERGWGRIVSVLSLGAREHSGTIAYGTAKAALGAYTRGLARNVARHGVVVTAVSPGATLTENGHWAQQQMTDPERVAAYLKAETVRGRFVEAREVAAVVAFLASEAASACGGTFVGVDAGQGRSYEQP